VFVCVDGAGGGRGGGQWGLERSWALYAIRIS
jgi:hypothetical protein